VTFSPRDYGHLEHGYAATVHKAQGVTVDRAHVLAGPGMDRHAAYVALTRHREGVALHWSAEAMGSREGLARALSRERAKDTSLDYAGPEATAAYAERRGLAPAGDIAVRTPGEEGAKRVRTEPAREAPLVPMLPAHRDAWGRDSLGRGTTPGEVAAAVAHDRRVAEEGRTLGVWLESTYRDPAEARRRLEALERAEGGAEGARRALEGRPGLLGELRGKSGWFASGGAKMERERAERCAGSIGGGLVRLREAEERAAGAYRRDVEAQRARDAVAVPALSLAAWSALRAVEAAGGPELRAAAARDPYGPAGLVRTEAQGEAWAREVAAKPEVAAELRAFAAAAERRLGAEGIRGLRQEARAARGGAGAQRKEGGLAAVGRALAAELEGRLGHAVRERAAERQRETHQPGMRQGRGISL
jgi:hypothetical protein